MLYKKLRKKNKNSSEGIVCILMLFSSQETLCSLLLLRGISKAEGFLSSSYQSWFEPYNFFSFLFLNLIARKIGVTVEVCLNIKTFSVFCFLNYQPGRQTLLWRGVKCKKKKVAVPYPGLLWLHRQFKIAKRWVLLHK